jgi:hypothetical protein
VWIVSLSIPMSRVESRIDRSICPLRGWWVSKERRAVAPLLLFSKKRRANEEGSCWEVERLRGV